MPLRIENLSKHFGGLLAVDNCSLDVEEGTITGLIGPNGAGKTTLFNLITGFLRPDSGSVAFNGSRIDGLPPFKIVHKGIVKTFQIPREFDNITVLENVMIADRTHFGERLHNVLFRPKTVRECETSAEERARDILNLLELGPLANELAKNLSGGQKKLLELGRALMTDPRLLLLDEPVAGVNHILAVKLLERIEELRAHGKTFFLIEHDMDVVMNHCDRIIVMHNGRKLAEGSPAEVKSNPQVVESYLGG